MFQNPASLIVIELDRINHIRKVVINKITNGDHCDVNKKDNNSSGDNDDD